jgi:hypothetical protein
LKNAVDRTLIRTDVSEERIAYIVRMTRIGELGTTLAVTNNRRTLRSYRLLVTANVPSTPIVVTLMMEVIHSSETLVLAIATRRNSLEEAFFVVSAVKT